MHGTLVEAPEDVEAVRRNDRVIDGRLHDLSLLNAPVPLPAVPGLGPALDTKQGEPAESDLVVSFNISATGKAVNLERIQFPVVEDARGPERILRRLKKMRFRPVFEHGRPVESETITWVFDPKNWAMPGSLTADTST